MIGTLGIKAGRVAVAGGKFAGWEMLSRTGIVNPRLLPSASDTLVTLTDLLGRSSVRSDILVTGAEALNALDLAMPNGALIGVLIAEHRIFAEVAKPLVFFVPSIRKCHFLPVFILVFGVGFSQKVG